MCSITVTFVPSISSFMSSNFAAFFGQRTLMTRWPSLSRYAAEMEPTCSLTDFAITNGLFGSLPSRCVGAISSTVTGPCSPLASSHSGKVRSLSAGEGDGPPPGSLGLPLFLTMARRATSLYCVTRSLYVNF